MRALIASAASVAVLLTAFVPAGVANAAEPAGSKVVCMTGSSSGSYNIKWERGGNGRCPGQVLASDAAKLATLAQQGKTDLRVAFYIPEKCPASEWASVPVKVKGDDITLQPWYKTCAPKYFNPYAKK